MSIVEAEQQVATPPDAGASSPAASGGPVDLGGRCEIDPTAPLRPFDGPGGPAFACAVKRDRKIDLYATIVDHDLPVRIDALPALRAMEHPAVLRVLDWGVVDWTPHKRRRFTVVFERPLGRRLFDDLDDVREPISEDGIARGILPSLSSAIREFQRVGIPNGAIRPTNLFYKDGSSPAVMLGDCVTVPQGVGQSIIFETVERGLTDEAGRGPASIADDLYALGATLMVLHLGRNPVKDLSDAEIMQAKMERGSYAALAGVHRIGASLIEPLRGLLADDRKQRWTLSDIDQWIKGRRLSPRQSQAPKKSTRALSFGDKDFWHCRAAAMGLAEAPSAAHALIENGNLDKWIRRSVNDETRAEAVQQAIRTAGAGNRGGSLQDRTVARVTIALDPQGPVRFKGRKLMPLGFGPALAEMMAPGGGGPQPVVEMIFGHLPIFWVNCQTEYRTDHGPTLETFDAMRALLEQTGPGYGVERILYELNPTLPCQSPLIKDHYALTCAEVLAALDREASARNRGRDLMDRHIAAFITKHNAKMNERMLVPLGASGSPERRIVAVLNILADTQRRFGPARLPGLCGWLNLQMEPAFKLFRNRQTQEKVRTEAQRIAAEGSIEALLKLVDNAETLKRDERGFQEARKNHESLTKRIEKLRRGIRNHGAETGSTGRQIAAVISCLASIFVMVAIALVMTKGG